MEKVNRTAIIAGVLVGMGVIVNTSSDNKYIGSMLFSLALLAIIHCVFQLYTGRIGYRINKRRHCIQKWKITCRHGLLL
jgi:formate/nitrite transporter FocA (FNT family)